MTPQDSPRKKTENEDMMTECCKCGWMGRFSQQIQVPSKHFADLGVEGWDHTCPQCGHDSFYRIDKSKETT